MKSPKFKGIIIFMCIITIILLSSCALSEEDSAYNEAKSIVMARAKYPDTIKFISSEKFVYKGDDGIYDVYGACSSENGFGATVRLSFEIKLKPNKSDSSGFDIVNVDINQR